MQTIPLFTSDGRYIQTVMVPPSRVKAEVIMFEDRAFIRDRLDDRYVEGLLQTALSTYVHDAAKQSVVSPPPPEHASDNQANVVEVPLTIVPDPQTDVQLRLLKMAEEGKERTKEADLVVQTQVTGSLEIGDGTKDAGPAVTHFQVPDLPPGYEYVKPEEQGAAKLPDDKVQGAPASAAEHL